MKKNILLFAILLFLVSFQAQKKYSFDYVLEFDKGIKVFKEFNSVSAFWVNSSNNSFLLMSDFNQTSSRVFFLQDLEGALVGFNYQKKDFDKEEKLYLDDCNIVSKINNKYKYKTKDYFFENQKDTIINDKSYYHYTMKSNKSVKYQKKKNIVSYHYVVDKNSSDFLPFLFHSTAYNEWEKEKNIPNGAPFIIYYQDVEGNIVFLMKLKRIIKKDKILTLSDDCLPKQFAYDIFNF